MTAINEADNIELIKLKIGDRKSIFKRLWCGFVGARN